MRKAPNDHLQNAIAALYESGMISLKSIMDLCYFGENDDELAKEILEIKESNRHLPIYKRANVQRWLNLYEQNKKHEVFRITNINGCYRVGRIDGKDFHVPWSKIEVQSVDFRTVDSARDFIDTLDI